MQNALILSFALSALAFFISLVCGKFVISHGPRDHPDGGRKNQTKAMPTSGGIAIFAAVFPLSILLFVLQPSWASFPLGMLLGGGLYMFLMGLWDDLVSLPALPKLFAQILIALLVAWFGVRVSFFDLGRHTFEIGMIIGMFGSAFWLVVVSNAVNFMDGSDGLAVGSLSVISGALSILAAITGAYDVMALSMILFAALLGHLFWNGRGKLFTGDSGSLFAGFYLAGLLLYWVEVQHASVWVAPLMFIAFLADVLLTLVWRYKHGRSLLTPHREHIYQIMLTVGISHPLTAWIYVWISLHGALIAGLSLLFPPGGAVAAFVVFVGILYYLHRRIRASAIRNGFLNPEPQ